MQAKDSHRDDDIELLLVNTAVHLCVPMTERAAVCMLPLFSRKWRYGQAKPNYPKEQQTIYSLSSDSHRFPLTWKGAEQQKAKRRKKLLCEHN